jgi:hypothetical protein
MRAAVPDARRPQLTTHSQLSLAARASNFTCVTDWLEMPLESAAGAGPPRSVRVNARHCTSTATAFDFRNLLGSGVGNHFASVDSPVVRIVPKRWNLGVARRSSAGKQQPATDPAVQLSPRCRFWTSLQVSILDTLRPAMLHSSPDICRPFRQGALSEFPK